jgi:hypothetical protein
MPKAPAKAKARRADNPDLPLLNQEIRRGLAQVLGRPPTPGEITSLPTLLASDLLSLLDQREAALARIQQQVEKNGQSIDGLNEEAIRQKDYIETLCEQLAQARAERDQYESLAAQLAAQVQEWGEKVEYEQDRRVDLERQLQQAHADTALLVDFLRVQFSSGGVYMDKDGEQQLDRYLTRDAQRRIWAKLEAFAKAKEEGK